MSVDLNKMAEDIAYIRGRFEGWSEANETRHQATEARVTSLEKTNSRQWWLHGIQATLIAILGAAKKYGVI